MQDVLVGIDVGTYSVKVVIATPGNSRRQPLQVLGQGLSESRGLRHGYIINNTEAVKSIKSAVKQAEAAAGIEVDSAFLSVGGVGLSGVVSNGQTTVESSDDIIAGSDLENAIQSAEQGIPRAEILNRRIVQSIPLEYKVDGKKVLGDPTDLKGTRLETKGLFITCLENHIVELIEAVEEAGLDVIDVYPAPIAASYVTLSKTQRMAGTILANIGAETMSIVVFEEDKPVSLEVFPVGSQDITNDIALGFKITLEDAERMKRDARPKVTDTQKELENIMQSRLLTMLDLVETHLKKIGRNGLLPAGIVITGGGSGIGNVDDLARSALSLPSRRAQLLLHGNKKLDDKTLIQDATWAVAVGLCLIGRSGRTQKTSNLELGAKFKFVKDTTVSFIKKFLP